ncbi:type I site-specific deoxyribonuclease [Dokdonia sp. MED134]|uniref:restriction endonuclease subunit S n=1 Tax=Dokdonia sp. MED134 TaxID=313590 RepID=UPI000068AC14|nr:restriction endonuclease subunit S [Dokdonia sp. MED134]EAQ40489.1 type I site-specific deoxyribonuclease [Dokdonia sp. MED134]
MKQKTQTLTTVCAIKNGFAFKSKDYLTKGIPLLRISNFNDGEVYINDNQIYVDAKYLKSKNDFIVEKGDVLIALSGATTGKYGIYNFDFPSLLNQRIGLIKSGESDTLNSRYFYYYLNILKSEILRNAGGAAQPNISTKKIGTFEIPLPPLETQKRIAQILDDAAALRDTTAQLLKEYDLLAQSIFLEMFGDPVMNPKEWIKTRFANLVSSNCPLTYGIVQPGDEYENGIPCVRPVDLTSQYISVDNLKKIDPAISNKFSRTILEGGEILLSVRGSVGVISIADDSLKGANVTRGIVPIWFDKKISNRLYFYYLYKTKRIQNQIKRLSKGATLVQINLKDLRELKIIQPPIELQNQFANKIALIEQQKALAKQELQESEDLFNCLLQKAFKGELV